MSKRIGFGFQKGYLKEYLLNLCPGKSAQDLAGFSENGCFGRMA